MAVERAVLKIGPFKNSISGKPFGCLGLAFPHLDNLNMEGTSSAAVVEPKKKSQDPAAKAKRIKGLLVSKIGQPNQKSTEQQNMPKKVALRSQFCCQFNRAMPYTDADRQIYMYICHNIYRRGSADITVLCRSLRLDGWT